MLTALIAVILVAIAVMLMLQRQHAADRRSVEAQTKRRKADAEAQAAARRTTPDEEQQLLAVARFRIPPSDDTDPELAAQAVLDALENAVRAGDEVHRYGPEEFCVMLPGATPYDSVNAAERLKGNVERAVSEITEIRVTIGLAVPGDTTGRGVIESDDARFNTSTHRGA